MYYIIIDRSLEATQIVRIYLPNPKSAYQHVWEDLNMMSNETSDLDVLQFENLIELNIFLFDNRKR